MAQSNGDDRLKRNIELATEAVFNHSIALSHGMTHQEAAEKIMQLILADRKQHELDVRKPLERMLEKLGVEKCPVCKDFMIDDDANICEGCNYAVHEWCTGYSYNGDGEYPAESAYAICKSCYKPELEES